MNVSHQEIVVHQKVNRPDYLKDIRWVTEQHMIVINNRIVPLTALQYQFLFPLQCGAPLTYAELAERVYHCRLDAQVRVLMDKHMDRIRHKLLGTGIYVYCVNGYGYVLLPESA